MLDRREPRPVHDPWRYQDVLVEEERAGDGRLVQVATIFLTGRECPWRCVMCDLWRYTTPGDTPPGAIPAQVRAALATVCGSAEPPVQAKLYNAGSFFDPRAVPESDYASVASALSGIERVIVESHPALVGSRMDRFLEVLEGVASEASGAPRLEVAMGLETAHPEALERLHKRMTLDGFARAADSLRQRDVALRVFLLVCPPFVPAHEQQEWLLHSIDVAFANGASVVSLVPTRQGNGALDALAAGGLFRSPPLDDIEGSLDAAHRAHGGRGRLFVDLWDLERFATCPRCFAVRRQRLHDMNLAQRILPAVPCDACPGGRAS